MIQIRDFLILFAFLSPALAFEHCTATQKCWPSPDTWSAFNSSIGGHLVAPRPPAWPCHDPNYDEESCNDARSNWSNSFWRSNQTGAMQNPVWDSLGCDIDSPQNITCDQGFVPVYSVVAADGNDVKKAVEFAGKYNLRLVVKNTGHDFLGRSSAEGSFSIWTHKLKGINFTDSFVASGCSSNTPGVPAVTVGAAEQWLDVYKAADERKVVVVGGAARSVGAAGGWVQGGGHSPLGGLHGMGVDNVLQFTVVTPDGKVVSANACQHKDLFWALRGGGSGTWGVTLDVTYKTHPPLDGAVAFGMMINTTNSEKLTELSEVFLGALPNITDQGVRGYGFWEPPNTLAFLLFHPNSRSVESTNNTLHPVHNWIAKNNETKIDMFGTVHSTFYEMFNTYIQDQSIAVPIWFGTRLVSRNAFATKSKELVKYIFGDGARLGASINIVGGGAISEIDPESTGLNPQWRKDALVSWTFGGGWYDDTPPEEIEDIKKTITKLVQEFGKIAGLDDAAYFNEADPREPNWKTAFFGSHYERLLEIKRQVDPRALFTCNRCVGADA